MTTTMSTIYIRRTRSASSCSSNRKRLKRETWREPQILNNLREITEELSSNSSSNSKGMIEIGSNNIIVVVEKAAVLVAIIRINSMMTITEAVAEISSNNAIIIRKITEDQIKDKNILKSFNLKEVKVINNKMTDRNNREITIEAEAVIEMPMIMKMIEDHIPVVVNVEVVEATEVVKAAEAVEVAVVVTVIIIKEKSKIEITIIQTITP